MASVDLDVTLELAGVGAVSGRLARVATGWCLLRGAGQDWVVRLEAVAAVHGASDRAVPELAWPPVARLGLGAALRRLADAAEPCTLHLTDGRRHDGTLRGSAPTSSSSPPARPDGWCWWPSTTSPPSSRGADVRSGPHHLL